MAHRFQFFVDDVLDVGVVAQLSCDDAHHLATIRACIGDVVDVVDAARCRFEAELLEGMRSALVLRVVPSPADTSSPFVHVYVGTLTSGARWDTLIDGCVQAGADAITPLVQSTRERDAAAKRADRGARIAKSAAQQSKRVAIPMIHEPLNIRDLPRSPAGIVLDLDRGRAVQLLTVKVGHLGMGVDMGVDVGVDVDEVAGTGDFEDSDSVRALPVVVGGAEGLPESLVTDLVHHGWQAVTLGPQVLRTELAAAVATSLVRQLISLEVCS